MNTKHTPGPWMKTDGNTIKCDLRPIGLTVDAGMIVASVVGGPTSGYSFPQDASEVEANARLIAAAPDLFDACNRTPNPIGTGTMSNCHILLMAVVALRNEGHMTLANELEAIQQHQKVAIAKATQP